MPRNKSLQITINDQSISLEELARRPFLQEPSDDAEATGYPEISPFEPVVPAKLAYANSVAGQHAQLLPKGELELLREMTQPGGPLAKLPSETSRAWAAFLDFAMMGPGRTLKRLYRHYRAVALTHEEAQVPAKSLKSLISWSRENRWRPRVQAFDEERHLAELAVWSAKRKSLREADWEDGAELRAHVRDLLGILPLFTEAQEIEVEGDEGDRIVISTVALNTSITQIVQALKAASDLQNRALEVPADPRSSTLSGLPLDAAIEAALFELVAAGRYDLAKLSSRGQPVELLQEDESELV